MLDVCLGKGYDRDSSNREHDIAKIEGIKTLWRVAQIGRAPEESGEFMNHPFWSLSHDQ